MLSQTVLDTLHLHVATTAWWRTAHLSLTECVCAAWVVFPLSLVFLTVHQRLVAQMTRRARFRAILACIVVTLAAFNFVLLPNANALSPTPLVSALEAHLPASMTSFVTIARHWVIAAFYGVAELLGDVAIALLFWGFATSTIPHERTEVLFPIFGVGANLAQAIGGQLLAWISANVDCKLALGQAACTGAMVACMLALALNEALCSAAGLRVQGMRMPSEEPAAVAPQTAQRKPGLVAAARCALHSA